MQKYPSFLVLPILAFCIPGAGAITLSRDARTDYEIVIAEDAAVPEKTAARELADYLKRTTGAAFPTRTESDAPTSSKQILIGPSARVRSLLPGLVWKALGADGIVMKTLGDTLVLAGGRPRGTLYAVYTFLEDVVGVRWWTSADTFAPNRPTLEVKKLEVTYVPRLTYREEFYYDTINNAVFPARLKLNGRHHWIPEEYGGHITITPWCHSFYQLLPPSKYFSEHPEWYSEIEGKRVVENAQLCLTNEEMRKEMVSAALESLKGEPSARIVSISQNDTGGRCQCANCRAIEEAEGSPSGLLIRFVNKVAEDVEKVRPDVLVETLAYDYAVRPPRHVKPRRNVLLRLAVPWSVDQRYPYSNLRNKDFGGLVRRWSAIAPNLFFWDYPMLYPNFLSPFPDWFNLGPNMRFFADSGAVGVFAEADSQHTNGEFVAMRAWVIAHLMWNPRRNGDKLLREFLTGYYGAAGPYLYDYLKLAHKASLRSGKRLSSSYDDYDPSFLTPEVLVKSMRMFENAEKAVAGDLALRERVRKARVAVDYVATLQYPRLMQVFASDPEARTVLQRSRPRASVPEVCAGLPESRWVDVQDGMFHLFSEPALAQFLEDPQASDGRAACMPGGKVTWAVQYHVPWTATADDGKLIKYRCYVSVRCEAEGKAGIAFELGVYDPPTARYVLGRTVTLGEVPDEMYHLYDLGTTELTRRMYIWADPTSNPAVRAVYIDRIVLVPENPPSA